MNRARLLDTLVMAEAIAAAAREALTAEARHEWEENDTRATWDMPNAKAVASVHQDALVIEDEQAFLAWLRERHPTEVVEVTELRVRNPEWLKVTREGLTRTVLGTGEAPPGTKLVFGGGFRTLSITVPAGVKAVLTRRAALALAEGRVTLLGDPPDEASPDAEALRKATFDALPGVNSITFADDPDDPQARTYHRNKPIG